MKNHKKTHTKVEAEEEFLTNTLGKKLARLAAEKAELEGRLDAEQRTVDALGGDKATLVAERGALARVVRLDDALEHGGEQREQRRVLRRVAALRVLFFLEVGSSASADDVDDAAAVGGALQLCSEHDDERLRFGCLPDS